MSKKMNKEDAERRIRKNEAYQKYGSMLTRVDSEGVLKKASNVIRKLVGNGGDLCDCARKAVDEVALRIWETDKYELGRYANRYVKGVEKLNKAYPEFAGMFESFYADILDVYEFLWLDSLTDLGGDYKSLYAFMKKVATLDGAEFAAGPVSGFGVDGKFNYVFDKTKFVCDPESGVSVMHAYDKALGIDEKVIVKKAKDETFDYEKAAMALLLKGVFGGGSAAVKMTKYVEDQLRASAVKHAKPEKPQAAKDKTSKKKAAK